MLFDAGVVRCQRQRSTLIKETLKQNLVNNWINTRGRIQSLFDLWGCLSSGDNFNLVSYERSIHGKTNKSAKKSLASVIPWVRTDSFTQQKAKGFTYLLLGVTIVFFISSTCSPWIRAQFWSLLVTSQVVIIPLYADSWCLPLLVVVYVLFISQILKMHIHRKNVLTMNSVPRVLLKIHDQRYYENGFLTSWSSLSSYVVDICDYLPSYRNLWWLPLIMTSNTCHQTKLLDWVGLTNFTNKYLPVRFFLDHWALLRLLLQTDWWFTAIIANQPFIKGKRIFGAIFFLAVPAFITILTFSSFNDSVGAINTQVLLIWLFFLSWRCSWKQTQSFLDQDCLDYDARLARFPYIYVLTLVLQQSIPNDSRSGLYRWCHKNSHHFPYDFGCCSTNIDQPIHLQSFNNFSIIKIPLLSSVGGGAGSTGYLDLMDLSFDRWPSPFYGGSCYLDHCHLLLLWSHSRNYTHLDMRTCLRCRITQSNSNRLTQTPTWLVFQSWLSTFDYVSLQDW